MAKKSNKRRKKRKSGSASKAAVSATQKKAQKVEDTAAPTTTDEKTSEAEASSEDLKPTESADEEGNESSGDKPSEDPSETPAETADPNGSEEASASASSKKPATPTDVADEDEVGLDSLDGWSLDDDWENDESGETSDEPPSPVEDTDASASESHDDDADDDDADDGGDADDDDADDDEPSEDGGDADSSEEEDEDAEDVDGLATDDESADAPEDEVPPPAPSVPASWDDEEDDDEDRPTTVVFAAADLRKIASGEGDLDEEVDSSLSHVALSAPYAAVRGEHPLDPVQMVEHILVSGDVPSTDETEEEVTFAWPRSTVVGSILALLLIAVSVASIFIQDANRAQVTEPSSWEDAANYVRDHYTNGDIVRIEPQWDDTPRVYLGDEIPTDVSDRARRDLLDDYARVWVMAAQNSGGGAAEDMPALYEYVSSETFGEIEVLLFNVPASAKPVYDFTKSVEDAKVRRVENGRAPRACSLWKGNAWHCGTVDPYVYVGARMHDVGGDPRKCVYAPPAPNGAWVEITYPNVPMASRIEGGVGLNSRAARSERGSSTDFRVIVDGKKMMDKSIGRNDKAFHNFSLDTTQLKGKTVPVTIRVKADDFFDRFLCFTARVPSD